jgi:hypothetical protein
VRYRRLLLVGHSHIHCMVEAYKKTPANTFPMEYVYLHGNKKRGDEPDFGDYVGKQILSKLRALALKGESPEQLLSATRQGRSDLLIAICLGGNAHNILGLIKANPPFDFVRRSKPGLPLEKGAQIIPEGAVREILLRRSKTILRGVEAINGVAGGGIVCFESPPPAADDEHVRMHLGEFFLEKHKGEFQVVSRFLRFKLWDLASSIMRAECKRVGIPYMLCPQSLLDEGMFMKPEGYADEATHGNTWYGGQMLLHLMNWSSDDRRGKR